MAAYYNEFDDFAAAFIEAYVESRGADADVGEMMS